jgi:hypothetical protein
MAVSTTLEQFGKRLSIRAQQFEDGSKNLLREVVRAIGGELVKRTPVDTGQARGNWLASIGHPRSDVITGGTRSEDEAFNQSIRPILQAIKTDDTVFITNSLDYIIDLKRGKSPQAPRDFDVLAMREGRAQGLAVYNALYRLR